MGFAPLNPSYDLPGRGLYPKHFLQESRRRHLVFAVGALFGGVLRIGEGVLGAAEDLKLEADLGGPQLLDQGADLGERRHRIFGPVQDQHPALMFFAASGVKLRNEPCTEIMPTIGTPVSANSTATVPPKQYPITASLVASTSGFALSTSKPAVARLRISG